MQASCDPAQAPPAWSTCTCLQLLAVHSAETGAWASDCAFPDFFVASTDGQHILRGENRHSVGTTRHWGRVFYADLLRALGILRFCDDPNAPLVFIELELSHGQLFDVLVEKSKAAHWLGGIYGIAPARAAAMRRRIQDMAVNRWTASRQLKRNTSGATATLAELAAVCHS